MAANAITPEDSKEWPLFRQLRETVTFPVVFAELFPHYSLGEDAVVTEDDTPGNKE